MEILGSENNLLKTILANFIITKYNRWPGGSVSKIEMYAVHKKQI